MQTFCFSPGIGRNWGHVLNYKEKEMKDVKPSSVCPLCGGAKTPGKTTFTADLGFGVVVVRDIPATVCSQCGADWITDSTEEEVEALVGMHGKNTVRLK